MNDYPPYIIDYHDNLPGYKPHPYYPGWSVSKKEGLSNRYANSGFIFGSKEAAIIWAETGAFPSEYWAIDWNLYPDENSVNLFQKTEAAQ